MYAIGKMKWNEKCTSHHRREIVKLEHHIRLYIKFNFQQTNERMQYIFVNLMNTQTFQYLLVHELSPIFQPLNNFSLAEYLNCMFVVDSIMFWFNYISRRSWLPTYQLFFVRKKTFSSIKSFSINEIALNFYQSANMMRYMQYLFYLQKWSDVKVKFQTLKKFQTSHTTLLFTSKTIIWSLFLIKRAFFLLLLSWRKNRVNKTTEKCCVKSRSSYLNYKSVTKLYNWS